ncbi:hypothetical protein LEMLEM_LOCUS15376 [Lemmus lemmus]
MELLSGSASSAQRGLREPPQLMDISSTLLEDDDVDTYYSKPLVASQKVKVRLCS